MNYSEAIQVIDAMLKTRHFKGTRGLFTRKASSNLGHWLAISGNDLMLTPNLGVVSYPVNNIAQRLLTEVYSQYPGKKIANTRGPPLVIVPLAVLMSQKLRAHQPAAWEGGAPLDEATLDALISVLDDAGEKFYSENMTLANALVNAETFCRFRPGQDHLIPIAMALCGRISEVLVYGEARSTMLSSNPELANLFRIYIKRIVEELG